MLNIKNTGIDLRVAVEFAVEFIECPHQILGRELRRQDREVDYVREEDTVKN